MQDPDTGALLQSTQEKQLQACEDSNYGGYTYCTFRLSLASGQTEGGWMGAARNGGSYFRTVSMGTL